MRYNVRILRMDSGRPAHSALHVRFHRFIPTGTTIPANTAASQPRAPRRHRNILVITAHRRPLPQSRTGGFICAVPCGAVLRAHARLVSLRVSAGRFLRLHAAVSLSYSLQCVFPGRGRNLFFRGVVSLPPPPPPALPALQACRGALHTGLFFFAVPCGAVLRMHARLVSLRVSAGRFLRLHTQCSRLQTARVWAIYQRLSDFPFKK